MIVALVDDHNEAVLLVDCATLPDAESLARAAVFSDGGISAYLAPAEVSDSESLRTQLRSGANLQELNP